MVNDCLGCHFASKEYAPVTGDVRHIFSLSQPERDNLRAKGRSAVSHHLKCHMGVWDEGLQPSLFADGIGCLLQDRSGECFFFEHRTEMLFDAAVELEKRRSFNRQLLKSNRFTQFGLFIASLGLIANVLIKFL